MTVGGVGVKENRLLNHDIFSGDGSLAGTINEVVLGYSSHDSRRRGGGEVGRWRVSVFGEESGKGCTFGLPRRKKIVLGGCSRGKWNLRTQRVTELADLLAEMSEVGAAGISTTGNLDSE